VTAGGQLRGVSPGTADVTATVQGRSASARVTVTLETAYDLFFEAWSADAARFNWLTRDLRAPAAESQLLMAGSTIAASPVPSPGGDRIAFTLSTPLRPLNQLRIVNLQRETLWFAEFPGEVADAAWSADGDRLAFAVRSAETGFDIWVVGADGTGAVNLTAALGPGNDTQPSWAPAAVGKLAFTRGVDGQVNVWTVDADGANPARLTTGGADADPAWSPDGSSIAFQRSGAAIFGDLFFVSPAGVVQRSLVGLPGIQGRPAWSPDGALVAFTSASDVYTVRAADGQVARRTFDGEATVEQRPGWLKRR
jgi:Tol biopolymer transport system component